MTAKSQFRVVVGLLLFFERQKHILGLRNCVFAFQRTKTTPATTRNYDFDFVIEWTAADTTTCYYYYHHHHHYHYHYHYYYYYCYYYYYDDYDYDYDYDEYSRHHPSQAPQN